MTGRPGRITEGWFAEDILGMLRASSASDPGPRTPSPLQLPLYIRPDVCVAAAEPPPQRVSHPTGDHLQPSGRGASRRSDQFAKRFRQSSAPCSRRLVKSLEQRTRTKLLPT
jgi:hypothetical protein